MGQTQLISVLTSTGKSSPLVSFGENLFAKENFIVNLFYLKILHQPVSLFILVINSSISHSRISWEPNNGNYPLIYSTCHVHSTRSPYPLQQTIAKAYRNPVFYFESRSKRWASRERADSEKILSNVTLLSFSRRIQLEGLRAANRRFSAVEPVHRSRAGANCNS